MASTHPHWSFVLVDLRNHGDSVPCPAPHTVRAAALDVVRLAEVLACRIDVIWGHSFGGKVALEVTRHAEVGAVWSLDSPPGPYISDGDGEVERLIGTLRTLPGPFTKRGELIEAMVQRGFAEPLGHWMTTNLRRLPEGGYGWRFDLSGIEAMLADYRTMDRWDVLAREPEDRLKVALVIGGRSDRWSEGDLSRVRALEARGSVKVVWLAQAGHWLHVDAPEALAVALSRGLSGGRP
jgi:esterase